MSVILKFFWWLLLLLALVEEYNVRFSKDVALKPGTFLNISGSKSRNTPDTPHFCLENKMFHNMMFALSYQLSYICFTCYHYINNWFMQLLYIFCMMKIVRTWEGNTVLWNIQWEIKKLQVTFRAKMVYFSRNFYT